MLFLFNWKRKSSTPEPVAEFAGGKKSRRYLPAASWEPYVAPQADAAAIARKKRKRDDEFFMLAMQ